MFLVYIKGWFISKQNAIQLSNHAKIKVCLVILIHVRAFLDYYFALDTK